MSVLKIKANDVWVPIRTVKGDTGDSLEYNWDGTQLGVRAGSDGEYTYVDLKGDNGTPLEFSWSGTSLGVRVGNSGEYTYVDLKGNKGDTGSMDSSATMVFTEAQTRVNVASGDALNTMFGKIKKFFTDLKTVAFTGSYSDLSNKPTSLKSPKALTFGGKTYDGSAEKEVLASDLGAVTKQYVDDLTAPEVFIATYGTTTSAEIEAAYQAGKVVMCKFYAYMMPLTARKGATLHYFTAVSSSSSGALNLVICSEDTWDDAQMNVVLNTGGTMVGTLQLAADTTPSTAKARNTALVSTETTPSVNGQINWLYQ